MMGTILKKEHTKQSGFTIVELLVVIVVIAILAAITIVAYSGITNKAKISSIKSDLSSSYTLLYNYNTLNSTFPPDQATANTVLKPSSSTILTYSYSSTDNTYCLTGTLSGISYNVTSVNNSPLPGACSGQTITGTVATGPTITNYALNPALTNDATTYSGVSAPNQQRVAINDLPNFSYAWQGDAGGDGYRIFELTSSSAIPLNVTSIASVWVKATSGLTIAIQITDSGGSTPYNTANYSTTTTTATGSWQRISTSFKPTASSWRVGLRQIGAGTGTLDMTGIMITTGSTIYGYSDGSYNGWSWDVPSSPNNSTSSGPSS